VSFPGRLQGEILRVLHDATPGLLAAAALACTTSCLPARAAAAPGLEPVYRYQVANGETLIGLARRFLAEPARWRELSRSNALRDPNRIATGAVLRIPLRLMRTETAPATVLSVTGGASAQAGQSIDEGGEINTGPDGHVSLRLVDGTLLRLRPDSRLLLHESRRVPATDAVRSGARLEQGRVEVEATRAPAGRPGFRIDTPQGVLGVRGTEFRVATDAQQHVTRGEVLSGVVAFEGGFGAEQRVAADFGAVIGADGRVMPPAPLLGAPDTSGLPPLEESILMRFALPPTAGAVAYRGQIAHDASFDRVVAELTSDTPELRFAELPDGEYVLRVRAIDSQGLEGRDADHAFRLKARPEAPLPSAPVPRAKLFGGHAEFAWAANPEAQSYRLQLADDAGFTTSLRELGELRTLTASIEGLSNGTHYWRLASVRGDADKGPWGLPHSFEMRPLPAQPPAPAIDDRSTRFSWEGEEGQSFDFEVARDAAFTDLVFERRLAEPRIELAMPGSGRFYFRLRARDADGFIGPYTTPQFFDVPNCLRDGSGQCIRAGGRTIDLAP